MLAIPALAVVVMGFAIASVRTVLLNPLGELVTDAGRITRGENPRLQRSSRTDEIGVLINAFTGMIDTLHDRETALSGALTRARELTAQFGEAQERSEKARVELETVIETVPAALLLVDRTGGVRFQNRAATMLIGPPPDKNALEHYESGFTLAGRDGAALPLDKWPLMRALDGETIGGEDLFVRRSDGREMPMLISAAPMNDALGQPSGAVVVFQDVSALKAIDRLKDEFVSIVSHELRTPLTSIRGSLQLVLDEPGSVPDDDHRQLVRIALNNCERLIRIINDILDIAKIEAGKTALQLRSCVVRDLVAAAIESVEGMARSAEVAFAIHIPDGLPSVEADADRMTQVLVNLLSNAVKFAPPARA
ncbi:MAG: cell wall metabolism sensor histidine kinase WalK [Acidobacteriota bacterium]|nr:cell wall metabolism sensor histidine kinase WalK [Acidobacteriota bacterium]